MIYIHTVFSVGVGRVTVSKYIHVLIPRTSQYVTLHVQRDLAGVIKLRALRCGEHLGLPGRPGAITRSSQEGGRRAWIRGEGMTAGPEGECWEGPHKPWDAGMQAGSRSWRSKKWDFPHGLQGEHILANTSRLAQAHRACVVYSNLSVW